MRDLVSIHKIGFRLLRKIHQVDSLIIPLHLLNVCFSLVRVYAGLFLTAGMIDDLLAGDYAKAAGLAIALLFTELSAGTVIHLIKRKTKGYDHKIWLIFYVWLREKAFSLDYETMERQEVSEKILFSERTADMHGSLGVMLYHYCNILEALLNVLLSFFLVIGLCLGETSKDPIAILERMMAQPFCHMHGPEHHVMVGAALLTAYKNAGGELDLPAALQEMYSRGKDVPGGACGFWGACGAGISAGIFASIVSKATPLAAESFGLAHQMTSRALESIGMVGGPRCCKRDSYLSILAAIDFTAAHFNIQMEKPEIVCRHAAQNNQCIGSRCPFAAVNHEKQASG